MALTHPQMAALVDGVMDLKVAEMGGKKVDFEKEAMLSGLKMKALVDRKRGPDGSAKLTLADLAGMG